MADIELVIKIPEWKYKSICEGVEASKRCGVVGIDPDIHEAIYNGTPLPKGHGDLIDADEIQFENTEFETYGDYCIAFDAIDTATPIIEADKEAENE